MKFVVYCHNEVRPGEVEIQAESEDVAKEIAIKRMLHNYEHWLRTNLTIYEPLEVNDAD